MTITGIDHVQLAMPAGGEDAARAFYTGLLGLPERAKPARLAPRGFYTGLLGLPERAKPARLAPRGGCWFEAPGVKVHLGVEAAFRPALKAHPGLLTSDLAALVGVLVAAGLEVAADEPDDGRAHCYVSDPFGNRIELLQA